MKILNLGAGKRIHATALNVDINRPDNVPFNVNYITADICELFNKYRCNNLFDKVYAVYVLEHLEYSCLQSVLWGVYDWLKPSGEFIILTDDLDSIIDEYVKTRDSSSSVMAFWRVYDRLFGTEEPGDAHRFVAPVGVWLELLKNRGFEVLEVKKGVGARGTSVLIRAKKPDNLVTEEQLLSYYGFEEVELCPFRFD